MKEPRWIVTNERRMSMDSALDARIVISAHLQVHYGLPPAERAEVAITAYWEPGEHSSLVASGLVLLGSRLYRCEINEREEDWLLIEPVAGRIARLHREALRRHTSDDQATQAWQAFHLTASELAAQLPVNWRAVECNNPTQNHTGSTNGANHIVLEEPLEIGCLLVKRGDALCQSWEQKSGHLSVEASAPTCKRCLHFAEMSVRTRVAQLLEGSFSGSEEESGWRGEKS